MAIESERYTQTGGSLLRTVLRLLDMRLRYARKVALQPSLAKHGPRIDIGTGSSVQLQGVGRLVRGRGLQMRRYCIFAVYGDLCVGRDVFFNSFANVSVFNSVVIGDEVRFGERVSIHDSNHVFEPVPVRGPRRREYDLAPIEIGDRVWVGANVTILAGTTIPDDCVVAAGSVVRGAFKQGSLIAGNPARVRRKLEVED